MATFNKFNYFVESMLTATHDLRAGSHVVKVYLATAVPNATNSVKADIADIASGHGYTAGGTTVGQGISRTGGTVVMTGADIVWSGTGTGFGPFRYAVMFNDTPAAPVDPLIGYWDYGSNVSVAAGESFTVDIGTSILSVV